jgi:hypothetical protein
MGRHGPQKKLAAIKILEGNPGKRIIEESGIEALGTPFIAEHLLEDARGCIAVVQASMPGSVYCALDSFQLAAFGMAWAIHKRAAFEISNPDFSWIVVNASGTLTPSPWLKVLNAQASLLATLGDRLGLDPKSRSALKLPSQRKRSKFAGLIGRAGSFPSLSS